MGGLTEKSTFFGFIFTSWNRFKIFYETEIVRFTITTEWPYTKKHCWKRLSDFNEVKFYQYLYHCKRKRLNKNIKTFNWLVLGNKCEIYLFTKEKKKKKGNTTDMTLGSLSYHEMFSNRGEKEIQHDVFVSGFKKYFLW